MKWLKILIYSLPAMLFMTSEHLPAQKISVSAGIYDFMDNTTREFYLLSPVLLIGYDVWNKNLMSLNVSTGLSFNSIKYNNHHHFLYMVPINGAFFYEMLNPGAKVWPVIGMGISLMGKADKNKDFDKTHYSATYGYHATGEIRISMSPELLLKFALTYNGLMPSVPEEVDLRGMIVTMGVVF
jgi:hypothetical protein